MAHCEHCKGDLKGRTDGFVARFIEGVVYLFCDGHCARKFMLARKQLPKTHRTSS